MPSRTPAELFLRELLAKVNTVGVKAVANAIDSVLEDLEDTTVEAHEAVKRRRARLSRFKGTKKAPKST
jgi:hypothetical protein